MANFCWQCTEKIMDAPGKLNDLKTRSLKKGQLQWDLCEGCGSGWFDRDGVRVEDPDDEKKGEQS